MLRNSAVTGVSGGNVAGFPAVWTIVKTVSSQPDIVLALANATVLFAGATFFRLVAHDAENGNRHRSLQQKLYPTSLRRGKVSAWLE
jgi:hypothetical protein